MKALIDTHVFLWWVKNDPRLSRRAVELISDGNNDIYVSAASCWEIAIKAGLSKLAVKGDLREFIIEQINVNAFFSLPVGVEHALYVAKLPHHHRDPFDRILVAQAQLEEMPLVTADDLIKAYRVDTWW